MSFGATNNEGIKAAAITPANNGMRLAALIKEGGKKKADLMDALHINAASLASNLSYLNARGLAISEIDSNKAEFPMRDEDGVFYMGSYDEYMAKRASSTGPAAVKAMTKNEVVERAQKREDKASAALAKAQDKAATEPSVIHTLKVDVAKAELELASAMLAAVENGDYSHERCRVVDA